MKKLNFHEQAEIRQYTGALNNKKWKCRWTIERPMLSHLAEKVNEEKGFSPVAELALFFGMTSAETGEAQVGFSIWWRCGSAVLLLSVHTLGKFYCTVHCPLPYMALTWDRELVVGVYHYCGSPTLSLHGGRTA